MSDMRILTSEIENMGMCRLLEHQYKNVWTAITLAGRRILVKLENDKVIEIRK